MAVFVVETPPVRPYAAHRGRRVVPPDPSAVPAGMDVAPVNVVLMDRDLHAAMVEDVVLQEIYVVESVVVLPAELVVATPRHRVVTWAKHVVAPGVAPPIYHFAVWACVQMLQVLVVTICTFAALDKPVVRVAVALSSYKSLAPLSRKNSLKTDMSAQRIDNIYCWQWTSVLFPSQ